jgi:hypothetical protein
MLLLPNVYIIEVLQLILLAISKEGKHIAQMKDYASQYDHLCVFRAGGEWVQGRQEPHTSLRGGATAPSSPLKPWDVGLCMCLHYNGLSVSRWHGAGNLEKLEFQS